MTYKGKTKKELETAVAKTITALLEPVTRRHIPFAVTFGNHDRQVGISNADQFNDIYKSLPGCIGEQAEGIPGGGSSAVELVVHMVLLATVFKPFLDQPITNDALNMIGIESKGYLYTYLISTTVGYGIAFILNRKITFKADVNPTLSMILYAIMVVFTIFANGWIGSAMTTFAQGHNLTGGFWDMVIKLIGMAIPTLWTYPCNRFIIHRKKKPQTTATEKEEA